MPVHARAPSPLMAGNPPASTGWKSTGCFIQRTSALTPQRTPEERSNRKCMAMPGSPRRRSHAHPCASWLKHLMAAHSIPAEPPSHWPEEQSCSRPAPACAGMRKCKRMSQEAVTAFDRGDLARYSHTHPYTAYLPRASMCEREAFQLRRTVAFARAVLWALALVFPFPRVVARRLHRYPAPLATPA